MTQGPTVAGIPLPSASLVFLSVLAVHVLAGLGSAITGILAMLSRKGPGRHPQFGTLYFRFLVVVFASMAVLSAMRWVEDDDLFALGTLSMVAAYIGRRAALRQAKGWVRVHVTAMGVSYIILLTAFYVDNGKSLPVWRDLPSVTYWLLPAALGIPVILRTLRRHPLAQVERP